MSVKVKICGITSLEDARAAVDAGADALGFVFYEPSPRNLSIKAGREIIRSLPPFVTKVGVFVDISESAIHETIRECGLDAVQLHGNETPELCQRFAVKVIKAFRILDVGSLSGLSAYQTSAWLLDSFVPGKHGGTGSAFNWDLAIQVKRLGTPIMLAGGLTPENVADAVRRVQPYAVDVSSGVESAPGRKDSEKMRSFISAAKSAARSADL